MRLLLLVAGVVVAGLAAIMIRTPTIPAGSSPLGFPASGTVAAVTLHGSTASVILRTVPGWSSPMMIGGRHAAVTQDGLPLAVASVRRGDILAAEGTRVVDISQRGAELSGIVAQLPYLQGDPMVLQVRSQQSVLIDVTGHTRVSSGSDREITLANIRDADRVRVRGVLDRQFGEMTQVSVIVPIGVPHPAFQVGGSAIEGQ
jgi:hypothetical protein